MKKNINVMRLLSAALLAVIAGSTADAGYGSRVTPLARTAARRLGTPALQQAAVAKPLLQPSQLSQLARTGSNISRARMQEISRSPLMQQQARSFGTSSRITPDMVPAASREYSSGSQQTVQSSVGWWPWLLGLVGLGGTQEERKVVLKPLDFSYALRALEPLSEEEKREVANLVTQYDTAVKKSLPEELRETFHYSLMYHVATCISTLRKEGFTSKVLPVDTIIQTFKEQLKEESIVSLIREGESARALEKIMIAESRTVYELEKTYTKSWW